MLVITLFIMEKGGLYGMANVHALYRVPSSVCDPVCDVF